MYPAVKEMDAVHSGTGVFYQAMPAVGADGKNIMKLIPVQMIDGQFFQIQLSKPRMDPTPQKAVSINLPSAPVQVLKQEALNPSAARQIVTKQVSPVNASPKQVGLDHAYSRAEHPLQQQTAHVKATVPQVAAPATNCGMSLRLPKQLPVTVKSPALPRGQYLQIPPNAQIRTVPASELPPGIKEQILTSSAGSAPGSGVPSVVYVSPITTVTQAAALPADPALPPLTPLSKTQNVASRESPSKGPKPCLKLIPNVSRRSNSPIRWVIEEDDSSAAPNPHHPVNSPSVTSEILRAVAERENAKKQWDVLQTPASPSSQGNSGHGQENALVMCNGKVFFVAKKCSLSLKMQKSVSPTAATQSYEFNQTVVPSSQQSPGSVAPQIQPDFRIIIPDEPDEVIDLCDDDAQDDTPTVAAVSPPDEDNVIFVSYIPPKSESGSTQDVTPKPQTKRTDQTAASCSSRVSEQRSLGGASGGDGSTPGRGVLVGAVPNATRVRGSAAMDVETGSRADPSTSESRSGIRSPIQEDTHNVESSTNPATGRTSRQMDDHLLRQTFGITADVKIHVQRVDGAAAGPVPLHRESVRSAEDQQEPTGGLKEKGTDSHSGPVSVRREADPPPPSPHTDVPLKCSLFTLNAKPLAAVKNPCHSAHSSPRRTSCDVEAEPVFGYVEPIDEDFLSTDENDIPNSQDAAARPQTRVGTTTSRMGRTRKRTMCPCCVPGTQGPGGKSSAKSDEPEKAWAWTPEQTSKTGRRTKAVRKDVKASGRISCLKAESQSTCRTCQLPAGDSLAVSVDSDELKRHEQITRLRELLREKEAALELMRNT